MRIAFLGDTGSANTTAWLRALRQQEGVEVLTWSVPSHGGRFQRLRRVASLAWAIGSLRAWLRRARPDLVIAYRTTSYGFLAALAGRRPLVVAAQGESDVWPPDSPLAPIKARMARYSLTRADLVHAWSTHMTRSLLELGAPADRILVLPRGVDTDLFHPEGRRERGRADRPVAITTRGLHPEYGHDVILRALALLRDGGRDADLVIAGAGPTRAPLESQSRSLDLADRVHFVGAVANDKLPDHLRRADLYVSMPDTEGLSASLLEAIACGCFPVVSDLPSNREVIEHGQNGLLVPVGDAPALAAALARAIDDEPLRRRAAQINRCLIRDRACARRNQATFVREYNRLIIA